MGALVDYYAARRILDDYKIRSVKSRYVKSADDAVSFMEESSQMALKLISQKALHKSKSGLVMLGLGTERDVRDAYARLERRMAKLRPCRILAQQMVRGGTEVIVGGSVDAQFGKMILLGLGGIYVETFKDFALRLCPITRYDALSMVNQLRSREVIAPDRRSAEMIAGVLIKVSRMFGEGDFSELDLNPVILHDGTYDVVDLRILR